MTVTSGAVSIGISTVAAGTGSVVALAAATAAGAASTAAAGAAALAAAGAAPKSAAVFASTAVVSFLISDSNMLVLLWTGKCVNRYSTYKVAWVRARVIVGAPPIGEWSGVRDQSVRNFWATVSGKTNAVVSLLTDKRAMFKRFNKVYWFSPSVDTIRNLPIPDENIFTGYDPDDLELLLAELDDDDWTCDMSVLMVFDDLVTSMKKNDDVFLKLILNRRHILEFPISVIMMTQKFNKIPLELRQQATDIMTFKPLNKKEKETIIDELIDMERQDANFMLDVVFDKPHNFLLIKAEENPRSRYFKNFDKIEFEE